MQTNRLFRNISFALSAWVVLGLCSCEKIVFVDGSPTRLDDGSASLTLTTRSEGAEGETSLLQGRIYLFRQSEQCVQMFDIEEDDNTVTMQLASGTYRICAVGGDDLDRFTLPTQADAVTLSSIKLQEGKAMDNFFSKQISVTLTDGDNLNKDIVLERKVICLNKVEIKDVPTNVTAVGIKLASFHDAILLDGTFPDSPLTDYSTSLTKQSDGTTWQATPQKLLFPSAGNLTLNISFTTAQNTSVYSYTTSMALEANHHYNISSTYKPQAQLSATLTATSWDEEQNIEFEFNDTYILMEPVAGQFYNGCYVVSADEGSHTAVLLSEMISYDAPADGRDESAWRKELEKRMAALEKPINTANEWRLPTLQEVEIFTKDPNAVIYSETGTSPICFCEDAGKLLWAYTQKTDDGTYKFERSSDTPNFTKSVRLRPVIDISY